MKSFFYSLLKKKNHPNIHEKEYLLPPISAMMLSLCRGGVHYLITITAPWLGNRDRRQEQSPHSLHEFYFNLISPTIEKKKKKPTLLGYQVWKPRPTIYERTCRFQAHHFSDGVYNKHQFVFLGKLCLIFIPTNLLPCCCFVEDVKKSHTSRIPCKIVT